MESGRPSRSDKLRFAGMLFSCLLGGCAWLQSPTDTQKAADTLYPPSFENAREAALFERVCQPLLTDDSRLLLQKLAGQNLQLQAAWARFRQARAQAEINRASLFPSVSANLEWSRSNTQPQLGPLTPESAIIQEQYRGSVAAEYELDLWNRLGQRADAAELRAQARWEDARTLRVSLGAQLLESWYDLAFQQQQRDLLREQVDISQKLLDLLKQRFIKGQTSALDALQQKQQVEGLMAVLAQNRAQLALSRNQLQVLLGESPDELTERPFPADLPAFEGFERDFSISASLLAARPDLQSAYYAMQAADSELAAAVRQRLPGFRVSASVFDQSENIGELFDDLLWSVAAALSQPLFTGGRIPAQVDAAEAVLDEALLNYRQSMLTALRELADAWAAEREEAARVRHLAEQREIAEDAFELVRKQYLRGSVDFLRVLDALQSMMDVQRELLRTRRQHLSYRLQFCRALGSQWLPGEA